MHTKATPNHLVRKYYFTIPILPKVKILLYLSYPAGSQKMMTECIRWDERASKEVMTRTLFRSSHTQLTRHLITREIYSQKRNGDQG
jgi:hypothetical protein